MIVSDCSVWMWGWGSYVTQILPENTHFSCMSSLSCKTLLKHWEKTKQMGLKRITSDWLTSEEWVILKQQHFFFEVELAQSISSPASPTLRERFYFFASTGPIWEKKKDFFFLLKVLRRIFMENSTCVLKSLRNGLYFSACFFLCSFTVPAWNTCYLEQGESSKKILAVEGKDDGRSTQSSYSIQHPTEINVLACDCSLVLDRRWDVTDEVLDEGGPKLQGKLGQQCRHNCWCIWKGQACTWLQNSLSDCCCAYLSMPLTV